MVQYKSAFYSRIAHTFSESKDYNSALMLRLDYIAILAPSNCEYVHIARVGINTIKL